MASAFGPQPVLFHVVLAGAGGSPAAPDLADLESTFHQLTTLFRVAWAVSDEDTLRIEAQFRDRFPRGTGGESLLQWRFVAAATPLPQLRSLTMQSTVELLSEVPPEFLASRGAVAALAVLAERVFDLPLQARANQEVLRAERARWEAGRTSSELAVLTQQSESLTALAPQHLQMRRLELVAAPERPAAP